MTAEQLPVELRPAGGFTEFKAVSNGGWIFLTYRVDGVPNPLKWSADLQRALPSEWKRVLTPVPDFGNWQFPTSQVTGWKLHESRDDEGEVRDWREWSGAWRDDEGNVLSFDLTYALKPNGPPVDGTSDSASGTLEVLAAYWPSRELWAMNAIDKVTRWFRPRSARRDSCDCSIRYGKLALRPVFESPSEDLEGSAPSEGRTYYFDDREPLLGDAQICMWTQLLGGPEAFEDGHFVIVVNLTPDGENRMARWTRDHPGGALGTFFDGRLVSVDRYDFELRRFAVVEGLSAETAKALAAELETCPAFHVRDLSPCRWRPGEAPSSTLPAGSGSHGASKD